MNNVNWKEVKFYKFSPNIPVNVELAFDKPQNLTGEYGAWWKWGVFIDKKPYLMKSGSKSNLLKLIENTGKGRGDTVELTLIEKDGKTNWMVDGKVLNGEVPKDDENVTQIPPESGIDKMVNSLQKIQKYLDEVQMKLVSQRQEINKVYKLISKKKQMEDEDDVPF